MCTQSCQVIQSCTLELSHKFGLRSFIITATCFFSIGKVTINFASLQVTRNWAFATPKSKGNWWLLGPLFLWQVYSPDVEPLINTRLLLEGRRTPASTRKKKNASCRRMPVSTLSLQERILNRLRTSTWINHVAYMVWLFQIQSTAKRRNCGKITLLKLVSSTMTLTNSNITQTQNSL